MNNAVNYLNSMLNDNDTIVVACSSGPDSMCLLSLAMNLNKNIKIICAHVNHKVRLQSEEEYTYLENFCRNNNIVFEGTTLNKQIDCNFESEARKFRYEFLYSLKDKYNAKYILTAHHGDDLIETVLMRLSRGSNLSGYIGIRLNDKDFLRPLLYTTKDEILEYLNSNNIKYYLDNTNDEDEHTRNRYRHIVLPFLKKEQPCVHKKYLQFSKELESYEIFVNDYIDENKFIIDGKISVDKLLNKSDFIIGKTIELLIKDIQSIDLLDVSNEVLQNIIDVVKSDKSNLKVNLSNRYVGIKSYNTFYIAKEEDVNSFKEVFNGHFENEYYIINKISTSNLDSNNVIRLDSSEIKLPLIIRSREASDKMFVKNLGHKKIKDIFIDEKIDVNLRNNIPIVTDSNGEILWIPGIKKSQFDKSKTEKYDIILASERKQDK